MAFQVEKFLSIWKNELLKSKCINVFVSFIQLYKKFFLLFSLKVEVDSKILEVKIIYCFCVNLSYSEEAVAPEAVPKTDKSQHKFFNLTESSSIKKSELAAGEVIGINSLQKIKISDDLNTITNDQSGQAMSPAKNIQVKESEKNEEGHAFTMIFSEDVDSNCENQDETLPYTYTETKEPVSEKSKAEVDAETTHNKFSDSSSDNFILSQKRMIPSSSTKVDSTGKTFTRLDPHQDDKDTPMAMEECVDAVILQISPGLQKQQSNIEMENEGPLSLAREKSTSFNSENVTVDGDAHHTDVTLKDKTISSKEDCVVIEAMDEAGSSFKYQTFA